mmetsp:Transcript_25602/g.72898  ORF Transcript_25602/g.72898 Transcript_25602/m.72898 type:complete len:210 (-) Transcript_25602:929-1558(-)
MFSPSASWPPKEPVDAMRTPFDPFAMACKWSSSVQPSSRSPSLEWGSSVGCEDSDATKFSSSSSSSSSLMSMESAFCFSRSRSDFTRDSAIASWRWSSDKLSPLKRFSNDGRGAPSSPPAAFNLARFSSNLLRVSSRAAMRVTNSLVCIMRCTSSTTSRPPNMLLKYLLRMAGVRHLSGMPSTSTEHAWMWGMCFSQSTRSFTNFSCHL